MMFTKQFQNTNVDMRCHFDIEIGTNNFFKKSDQDLRIFFRKISIAFLQSFDSNQKLHQTVVTDCFRKKSPLTVTFHSTTTVE